METVIAAVVAPVVHKYVEAAGTELAVNTTFPPAQKVVGPPGVIVTTGAGFTVTERVPVPVQAAAEVTVTL